MLGAGDLFGCGCNRAGNSSTFNTKFDGGVVVVVIGAVCDRARRRILTGFYGSWCAVACSRGGLVFMGVPLWFAFLDVGSSTLISVESLP
jgi:hypothetical protein